MDYSHFVDRILRGESLSIKEAETFFMKLGRGAVGPNEATRILFLLNRKGVTSEEVLGAALAFRRLGHRVRNSRADTIDNCGTGGDGKDTFNISTAASFVIAACGVPVAKHGNRGVSSKYGSADLLQALGINIEAPTSVMMQSLKKTNFGYFHAPIYNKAMRNVGPFRRSVRSKTLFNMLGPLLNPLRVKRQLIGTFSSDSLAIMAETLKKLDVQRATLVRGMDGTDEVSISGPTTVLRLKNKAIQSSVFHPKQIGISLYALSSLRGGDQKKRVRDLEALFTGKGRPALRQAVALNAAFGIQLSKNEVSLRECFAMALRAMKNGEAMNVVQRVREITRG